MANPITRIVGAAVRANPVMTASAALEVGFFAVEIARYLLKKRRSSRLALPSPNPKRKPTSRRASARSRRRRVA
jgi:hypothetical protein